MDIKDVLLLCDAGRTTQGRIDTAFELATKYNAVVTAIFIPPTPKFNANGSAGRTVLTVPVEEQLEHSNEIIKSTKKAFIAKAKKLGIACEWIEDDELDIVSFINQSRYSDVAIAPQLLAEHVPNDKSLICDYLSTQIGKPLIVLPNKMKKFPLLNNVVIAWDESPQAARAVHDAIPLLKLADNVNVVMVPEEEYYENKLIISGQGLKSYLSHHGINVNMVTIQRKKSKIAKEILSSAKHQGAGLIVMGVYGHSRIRESVFGGTSKYLLKNTTIPLLVSH